MNLAIPQAKSTNAENYCVFCLVASHFVKTIDIYFVVAPASHEWRAHALALVDAVCLSVCDAGARRWA
jgi:hypothetical protein